MDSTGTHYDLRGELGSHPPKAGPGWRQGTPIVVTVAALVAVAGAVAVIVSIGGETHNRRQTDGAFIITLYRHHEAAIDLATTALERGASLDGATQRILDSHSDEVVRLRQEHQRLYGESIALSGNHGSLGLDSAATGASVYSGLLKEGARLEPSFVRAIKPNLVGSMKIARVELRSGGDERLKELARDVIAARQRELRLLERARDDGAQ